jgi:RNA polymerase sigma-70 factor (ECF subfamily)
MEDFNKIYEDNHRIVLSYVSQKLNDYTLAEEITNDIFIRINNCLDTFNEDKASMRTFIMASAKNAVIDQYRKRKLETISLNKDTVNSGTDENTFQSIGDKLICKSLTPIEVLKSKEKQATIEDAIVSLSETYFEVAYYFFKEELSYAEISEVMNISLGTVKGKISRARKSLQAKLVTV